VFVADGRVSGLIDWGVALYGDSLYDVALLAFWVPWFAALDEKRVLDAARTLPGAEERFDERIRAYELRIGLEHIAYNAYLGADRREEMLRVCQRTLAVARSRTTSAS
jgi:hygromycin-B 4-O-kinase